MARRTGNNNYLWLMCCLALLIPVKSWSTDGCITCPDNTVIAERTAAAKGVGSVNRLAAKMWREAGLAWREKDWPRVLPATDALIHAFPGTVWEARARSLRGLFLKFNDRWDEAMAEFDRVLALDAPRRLHHDVQTSRACVLMARGRYTDAESILDEILRETKDKDQIRYVNGWIKEIRRRREIQQGAGLNSCGARALAFVMRHSEHVVPEATILAALAPFDKDVQLSLDTLQKAASKLGHGAIGIKLDLDQIAMVRLPVLMLVKPGHYVVVTGMHDGKIALYDPERGLLKYSAEVLRRRWTGYGLLFGEDPTPKDIALVSQEEMAKLAGGVCYCCVDSGLGGDVPNAPQGTPGGPPDCAGTPGMPRYLYNYASLNLIVEDIDMAYSPTKGPAIKFMRSFNDDAYSQGDFGPQWTHSYNVSLTEFPGQVQISRGSGRVDIFMDLGDGNYDAPLGINETLQKNPDGTFVLQLWKEKLRYEFDEDGLLARIVDRNENPVTLQYIDNTPTILGADTTAPGYVSKQRGVVVDPQGNRYVADYNNNRIQKFRPDGSVAQVIGSLGVGDGQFNGPSDIALDPAGNIYVADRNNNRVCKLTSSGEWVKSWGPIGDGPGEFYGPRGIAVGGDDISGWYVYVVDYTDLKKYDLEGVFVSSGNGFSDPQGVEATAQFVYVTDTRLHRMLKFDHNGVLLTAWGSMGAANGEFVNPSAVAVDALGFVYVADMDNHRIQKFDADGVFQASWGSFGGGQGQFSSPCGIAVSGTTPGSQSIVVSDTNNDRLQVFSCTGIFESGFGLGGTGLYFANPADIAFDNQGNRYVVDNASRIVSFNASGTFLGAWSSPSAYGLAIDSLSQVAYVTNGDGSRIDLYTTTGQATGSWAMADSGMPTGVATDRFGNVYVADATFGRVQRFTSGGVQLLPHWGEGLLDHPYAVAADTADRIYVGDNVGVQVFDSSGTRVAQWLVGAVDFITYGPDGCIYLTTNGLAFRYDTSGHLLARWHDFPRGGSVPFATVRGVAVDANGRILLVSPDRGNVLEMDAYLPQGRILTDIIDATGGTTRLGFGLDHRIATLRDPKNRIASFFYNDSGQLARSVDLAGVESSFTYHQETGHMASMTIPEGTYTFLTVVRHATITNPAGKTWHIDHLGLGLNQVVDPYGNWSNYSSGQGGMLIWYKDAALGNTWYQYDDEGNRVGMIDAENHTTSWTVDVLGRRTSSTDALGRTTTWVYDDVNHTEVMTGPAPFNYVTVSQYDARENLLSITDPSLKTTTMTYYPDGRLNTVTTPLNKTTTYTHDDLLRTTTIRDPLGNQTVLSYDELGHLISRRDPLGNVTRYEYDNLGKRVREVHPDGTSRRWQYDCCGLESEIDERGRAIVNYRDEMRRVVAVVNRPDPLNPASDTTLAAYGYDDAGRRVWMKDTQQRQTDYDYDARGWLTSITYPDGTNEGFTYYMDRRLKSKTDRMGRTTFFSYDPTGRLVTKSYPDATVNYAYDEDGRMTAESFGQTSQSMTYTPKGQVETATQTLFGVSKVFRYQYFDDGSLQWWRDESVTPNKTTTYAYDDDGRLQTITDPDAKVFSFEYNADGSLRKKSYANGMWAEYEYSNRGWLTALRHRKTARPSGIMAQFLFKNAQGIPWYDAVGNRTAADVTGNEHHTYGYDGNNLDRLLAVDRPQTTNDEAYTYDAMGNRRTTRQYSDWTYDAQNDELDSWDSVSYTYDGNGNRATRVDGTGTTSYSYDYENRLIRVDRPGNNWTIYDYDAQGRRVRKNNNGTVTLYWYDGEDIVLETNAAGTEQARYTHGPGIDAPLKVKRGSATYYYHEDPLGSIVLMTDASKNSSRTYKYDAFGNVITQTGSATNFYMYTGREYDSETALYYYRARHYDPKVGRFLQRDPVPPRWQEMNVYVYVANNPTNLTDPSGLCNGYWKQVCSVRLVNIACICKYVCMPCDGTPVIWSGDCSSPNLPKSLGVLGSTCSGEEDRGDTCVCPDPGYSTGCPNGGR